MLAVLLQAKNIKSLSIIGVLLFATFSELGYLNLRVKRPEIDVFCAFIIAASEKLIM